MFELRVCAKGKFAGARARAPLRGALRRALPVVFARLHRGKAAGGSLIVNARLLSPSPARRPGISGPTFRLASLRPGPRAL